MIDPRSTSYPTLAVIQEFEITDPRQRELIWLWAERIVEVLRCGNITVALRHWQIAWDVTEAFGPRYMAIRARLHENHFAAFQARRP